MHTITWIQHRRLIGLAVPNLETARTVQRALRRSGYVARLWNSSKELIK